MNEFNELINNEGVAMDAMESAADIVKDVAVNSGSGTGSRMGVVATVATAVVGLVVCGAMLWRKHKAKKEELRKPDEEAPVELSDEDLEQVTTAE